MILILNDYRCETAGANLTFSLKKAFSNSIVKSVGVDSFIENLEHHTPAVIILPEIKGETNLYPQYLGEYGKKLIHHHVKKGALYAGFCAGAYNACSINRYLPDHGEHKYKTQKDLLALTSIEALGPLKGFGTAMDTKTHTDGGASCRSVPIIFLYNGRLIETDVLYENGPLFHVGDNDVPKEAKVLARYNITKRPAAALICNNERGKVLLSGVLPHLKKDQFNPDHPLWNIIKNEINQHLLAFKTKDMLPRCAWTI